MTRSFIAALRLAPTLALTLAACATTTPATPPPAALPPAPAAASAPASAASVAALARPSSAEVIAWSHALLEAYDRGDAAALTAALAPGFAHVEGGRITDAEKLLAGVRARKPGPPIFASRTWDREQVQPVGEHVVFLGRATERQGGNDQKGGYKYVGWYLVQWAPIAEGWRATLWTWHRAGTEALREEWNEIYRNGLGFSREPNRLLTEVVKGRRPGKALDVAMGQGRNALYLAAQGWQVTGVDVSDEGIRLARELATQRKLHLEAINQHLDQYDFGTDRWDLVTMIYATDNVSWLERIKPSLRRGGVIVVEYFAKTGDDGDGFAPGQLAALFGEGFTVLRDEVVEDAPDWAMDRATLVRFVAQKR